jgi:hypothetical protein
MAKPARAAARIVQLLRHDARSGETIAFDIHGPCRALPAPVVARAMRTTPACPASIYPWVLSRGEWETNAEQ